MDAGTISFYTSAQEATFAPAATVHATDPNGRPVISTFYAGDRLGDGTLAAGRRLYFGL